MKNYDLENGTVLFYDDEEPRLSKYDIDYENQDDDRDNEWFDEHIRGSENGNE